MRLLTFPGGWYNWALPSGEYCVLIRGERIDTHFGVVKLENIGTVDHPIYDNALFLTCSNLPNFKMAGQSHAGRGTLEWKGRWDVVGPSFSVNPQIYDLHGSLHIATTSHQGYRFVRPDNTLATGDETYHDPVKELHEWTEQGDLTVGFHGETLALWVDGVRRVITRGRLGSNTAHLNRDGDRCVVSWQNETEREVSILWFDRSEVDLFPLEEPVPPIQPPRCTILQFPTQVEPGQAALCTAAYSGGEATEARWQYRGLGEVIWVTDIIQAPPRTEHTYRFVDAGQYDISLTAIGLGGMDTTGGVRRITVKEQDMPEPIAKQQIAFGPNLGTNIAQLFTEPDLWDYSRQRISAFQLYVGHITERGQVFVGNNTFDFLKDSGIFGKLVEWGILLELQMASGETPTDVEDCFNRIAGEGGHLGAICFDHAFIESTPEAFSERLKGIKAMYPAMVIGVYAPFPTKSAKEIQERLVAWDDHGGRPDFLRIDCDPNQTEKFTQAVYTDIRAMTAQRGMALQTVINAGDAANTDAKWVTAAKAKFNHFLGLGTWDAVMVQSWATVPSVYDRQLPRNVLESEPDSHTALVKYCLERFPR